MRAGNSDWIRSSLPAAHSLSHMAYLPASVIHLRMNTPSPVTYQEHFGHCGCRHMHIWTGVTVAIILGHCVELSLI